MTAIKSDFWVFSDGAGPLTRKGPLKRWGVATSLALGQLEAIQRQDGPLEPFRPPLIGRVDRADRIEDVPFVYQDFYVVSDRIRVIFEEAGPGDCQFIPIDIQHRRGSLGLTYWVMHVLHTIDCADPKRSYNANKPDGRPLYMRAAIVPSRVPDTISTFRIRHGPSWAIVRDSLRRKLKLAKATGCMFFLP